MQGTKSEKEIKEEAEGRTEVLCESLQAQKLKKWWQMELPTRENQKRQT